MVPVLNFSAFSQVLIMQLHLQLTLLLSLGHVFWLIVQDDFKGFLFLISHAWEEHYSVGVYDGGAHLNGRRKQIERGRVQR